jgi:hypothetical protein
MTCLSDESPTRQADDPTIPASGRAFYYLIAGKNSCGSSRAGSTHPGGADVNPPAACAAANRETDGDALLDLGDNCPVHSNAPQADGDGDWAGDVCDNCSSVANSSQANLDDDQRGDACDNCPGVVNDNQLDGDTDLVGDACDNCPNTSNPDQANHDLDALGDACDPDDDNDTVPDAQDCAPLDATASTVAAEVAGLTVSQAAGTQLAWAAQGAGVRYDVAGGNLATLRSAGNVGAAICLADDQLAPSWPDTRPHPAPGQGYYYLSRAQNACGTAGYGAATSGAPRVPATDCP